MLLKTPWVIRGPRKPLFRIVGRHEADIREVPVALSIIHAVADDEVVGDGESDVVGVDAFKAARRLVEKRGDFEGARAVLEDELAKKSYGEAGIEDVLDEDDVFSFRGLIEVLDEFDGSAGALVLAVAGDGDEVKGAVNGDAAGEVGKENSRALEDSNKHDALAGEIGVDLATDFGGTAGDLFGSEQNGKILVGGGVAHSFRISRLRETRDQGLGARD